jgi:phosphoglycolate phosphatase
LRPDDLMPAETSIGSSSFLGVRVLVFDLDGTLIDSERDLVKSVNATLTHMGRAALPDEQIAGYVGRGAPRLIEQALGPGATAEQCRQGLEYFLGYYREHMLDHTVTYPGVRDGLAALEGMAMAVLTNKPVRFSQRIIERLGLAQYFRFVYGGNSFETKKPDPEGMGALLREFQADARQAMLVGDSDVDVQTARNAGTWACGVTYGFGSKGLVAYPPDLLVDSLTELAGYLDLEQAASRRG